MRRAVLFLLLGVTWAGAQDPRHVRDLQTAAEQGRAQGRYNLSMLHNNGEGLPQDSVKADNWISLAALDPPAELAKSYQWVCEDLAPDLVAPGRKLASEWQPKSWDELKDSLLAASR